MASPPSSAIAGAAVAASALASILSGLVAVLPLPASAAQSGHVTARRMMQVVALRFRTASDAAAGTALLIRAVQALARDAAPGDAAANLYRAAAATRSCAPVSASPALTRAYGLARAMCVGVEAACLGEAFLAEARSGFADRRAASSARDRITAAHDEALDRVAGALGQPAAVLLSTSASQCCAYLADLAGSLQPLTLVESGSSFPSTALAWSLYQDPARAADLTARNRCGTPLFMPATFEALVPKRS